MNKSIISTVALLAALALPTMVLAQDAGASAAAGGTASAQAGDSGAAAAAGASTSAQAGDDGAAAGAGSTTSAQAGDNGASANTSTDVSASASQAGGGSTSVGIQTDVNVNVTTEQTTEIKQVIVQQSPAPLNVSFSINLGTVVPADVKVKLSPLPARVIEIVPQFKGYLFFVLADGRIVIVAPDTLKIVAILTV